jgi:LmbE family N-acetylglucosaminyl deacetylase
VKRDVFVPDGRPLAEALARTTHLGIVAHADDLEILAYPGILECFRHAERWFTGIVVTDGAGSSRSEEYARVSDAEFLEIRVAEQKKAASLGEYAAVIQLGYTSAEAKGPGRAAIVGELAGLLAKANPATVYTHNPADRHDTHVAAALATLEACRRLPAAERPTRVLGGEVWRDLDWLADEDKVAQDVSGRDHLASALIGVYDSQIAGAKRYDLAVLGRRRANATYHRSHALDASPMLSFAMDLTPLVTDPAADVFAHVDACIARFRKDVEERLARLRRDAGGRA